MPDKEYYSRHAERLRAQAREFARRPEARAARCYDRMCWRCKNVPAYKGREVRFTKAEFVAWALNNPDFHRLCKQHEESGFSSLTRVTVDRIDNQGHYEFGNIRFLTNSENTARRKGSGCYIPKGTIPDCIKPYLFKKGHSMVHNRRLSQEQIVEIHRLRKREGLDEAAIAERFAISKNYVQKILRGASWPIPNIEELL